MSTSKILNHSTKTSHPGSNMKAKATITNMSPHPLNQNTGQRKENKFQRDSRVGKLFLQDLKQWESQNSKEGNTQRLRMNKYFLRKTQKNFQPKPK